MIRRFIVVSLLITASILAAEEAPPFKWSTFQEYEGRYEYEWNENGVLDHYYLSKFEPTIQFTAGPWKMHLEFEIQLWENDFLNDAFIGIEPAYVEWQTNWRYDGTGGFFLDFKNEMWFYFAEVDSIDPDALVTYGFYAWAAFTPRTGYSFGNTGIKLYFDIEWLYLIEGEWTAVVRTVPAFSVQRGPHYFEIKTKQLLYDSGLGEWFSGLWNFDLKYRYTVWKRDRHSLDLAVRPRFFVDTGATPTEYSIRIEPEITYRVKLN